MAWRISMCAARVKKGVIIMPPPKPRREPMKPAIIETKKVIIDKDALIEKILNNKEVFGYVEGFSDDNLHHFSLGVCG